MTYFNPNVYNVNNLTEEDAQQIKTADFIMTAVLDSMLANADMYDDTVLDNIQKEIYIETLEKVAQEYDSQRREVIVSIIDNYDNDVEEVENEEREWDNPFERE